MTHLDLKIDEATFAASLRVIGHPWRAGQRCNEGETDNGQYFWCEKHNHRATWRTHDIPIPAVTDELLMRMLRETLQRKTRLWEWWKSIWIEYWTYKSLDAAIIRATAALEEKS